MRQVQTQRGGAGYTLMEVLVALTILATGLTILLGAQATASRMSERANGMALAALMARSQMINIEHELHQDGFSDMEERMDGDFRDQGFDDVEWEAIVEVIEITPEAQEQFNSTIYEQLFGAGDEGGALSGSSGVSSFLPMIMAMIPEQLNAITERSRKVTLIVTWKEGRDVELSLTVQQYVVNMNPGGAEGEQPELLNNIGTPALQAIPGITQ
jgi:prepilin-type N-terminal cleavage/methylation domain-containing protein